MSSRQNYFQSQFQFSTNPIDRRFEFQESDVWNSGDHGATLISPSSPEPRQSTQPPPRSRNRPSGRKSAVSGGSSSLPVNIPDWSKILGDCGGEWRRYGGEDQDAEVDGSEDEDVEDWVPPHEYAARQVARRGGTVVAFSVQEGVGRTLKGRDLRRVRNAIWKQTGFED